MTSMLKAHKDGNDILIDSKPLEKAIVDADRVGKRVAVSKLSDIAVQDDLELSNRLQGVTLVVKAIADESNGDMRILLVQAKLGEEVVYPIDTNDQPAEVTTPATADTHRMPDKAKALRGQIADIEKTGTSMLKRHEDKQHRNVHSSSTDTDEDGEEVEKNWKNLIPRMLSGLRSASKSIGPKQHPLKPYTPAVRNAYTELEEHWKVLEKGLQTLLVPAAWKRMQVILSESKGHSQTIDYFYEQLREKLREHGNVSEEKSLAELKEELTKMATLLCEMDYVARTSKELLANDKAWRPES